MRCRFLILSLLIVCGRPDLAYSQAFVEHLSTPVFQRGAVTRVAVIGTETQGAVGLWSSLAPGLWHAKPVASPSGVISETSTLFDVEIDSAAPLGLYGLRLATSSGLSNVHLFLIDELPLTVRDSQLSEDAVQRVTLPVCVTAPCRPATIDRYAIEVQAGQRVTFEVVGNRFGKDYDPLIQIRNAAGKLVAQHDNSIGLFFDLRFAHTFASAGTYIVEVQDARFEGHPTWHYVLRMGDFPEARMAVPSAIRPGEASTLTFPQMAGWKFPITLPLDRPLASGFQEIRSSDTSVATWIPLTSTDLPPQLELEPNDSLQTASPVKIPGSLNGVLGQPGDTDFFTFELTQSQKLQIEGISKTIGSAADLEILVFDPDGREVRRIDDTELEEARFAFNAGKAGSYRLQVRDMARDGGPEFAYRIDVRAGGPEFQMLAETTAITVPQGSYQTLPLKITRQEFAGEIRLELHGAPPGVSLEPAIIPANATEFVANIVASPTALAGLATFQIIGKGTPEGGAEIQATATTKPLVDRQLRNVDLILYALREDQQHLPPSLTNQIALMVTPPSPFQIELPESLVYLTRFQTAEFPITTTRIPGFTGPITFRVAGGQIGKESEERNQVYARFTPATVDQPMATGTFYNRILTNLNQHRVDLTASAEVEGQRVNLIRTFTLDVRSAFQPTYEPAQTMAEPGGKYRFKILANRVPTFDGPLTFTLGPQANFKFPETVELPVGQPFVEVELQVDPKINPGRHDLRIQVAGFVNKYEEGLNLPNLQIEVKKP